MSVWEDTKLHSDAFGGYYLNLRYTEPDNGKVYEFRKYVNSAKIKKLGGMYCIYCEEDKQAKWYRSEYLRDRAYAKFLREGGDDISNQLVLYEEVKEEAKRFYHLPGKIDTSKLTDFEFKELRRLIKKGLVFDE